MAFSRNRVWSTLVTCGALLLSATSAHGFMTYHAAERAKSAAQSYTPARVTIDTSALFGSATNASEQAKTTTALNIMLPSGKRYDVARARVLPGLNGAQTFVGYFNSHGEDYRIYVTESAGAVSGIMMSPEGTIDIAPQAAGNNGNALLTSRRAAGHIKAINFGDDSRIPPEAGIAALLNKTAGSALITAEQIREARERAKAGAQVTIDLLVGYTPGMVTRFSTTAGVTSRLNTLVATMNDALTQSQVNLTIRLVNATQVSYSDTASNDIALTAISPSSTDPLKATIDTLRNQNNADLVALIRPYQRATHGGCGVAWVLGAGGAGVTSSEASLAFSTISDGTDTGGSGYYCDDLTFSHEIGHNLGLTHDRANRSTTVGATPYANGYINNAAGFGTIMSYASNRLARFSNPNIVCSGAPCGIARTDTANSADAAGAILTTMDAIAAFRAAVSPQLDTDGDGIPDFVESAEGRNPNLKDNAIFAGMDPKSNRFFAMQQYRDFLGREAEAAGLSGWTSIIATGSLSREQVIQGFFNSTEFQNVVSPVVRLYLGFFNRIPDHAGLTLHVGNYRNGTPLSTVASAFANSQEFTQAYGSLTNAQFVTLVYQNVLGRLPDQAGYTSWLNMLNNGASRGEVMVGFTESLENVNRTKNNVMVIMMYEGMLRRNAEPAGYIGWMNYLTQGNNSLELTRGFMNSLEYRLRFLPN
jgi:Metallo-peptidase family M12B Reprolysin-like/Domain of unknown function (DUF4214)